MKELLTSSKEEMTTADLHISQPMSTNRTITSVEDVLYNKYVVIGVILFFVLLLIIAILIQTLRAYRGKCCQRQDIDLYSHLTEEEEDDDIASLGDIQDNSFNRLYTSCQLCVSDNEVNTSMASVDIHDVDCDFEYDCSSLDNSVIGLIETKHIDDNSYSSDSSLRRGSLKILSLFKKDKD